MRVGGLLLAAGEGARFGADKLAMPLRGAMLGEHAARALAAVCCERVAVCRDGAPLAAPLSGLGYRLVINDDARAGLSRSLALGFRALDGCRAALVVLADMPNVTAAHLQRLLDCFDGSAPVASLLGEQRVPPAILPSSLWPALAAQTGDRGARALLAGALAVPAPAALLADVDTPADLASI